MKDIELNRIERKNYHYDSDIFNVRPPKTPQRFKLKKPYPIRTFTTYNNINTISTPNLPKEKTNHEKYYLNKKDHINDTFRAKTPGPNFFNYYYQRYRRTEDLKKDSKKMQFDKSYDYNYYENNNIYNHIKQQGNKGKIFLGDDPLNFSSEYNSMQDYARKVMLRKIINKEKMKSDILNKSVDIPRKFMPLRRKINHRKGVMKDFYTKNTANLDMNKSTDNTIGNMKKNNIMSNNLDFYKSNIFFDKDKDKANKEFDKYSIDYQTQRHEEKIKHLELEKEKMKHPRIRRKKNNFLYQDDYDKVNAEDIEEYKKFHRNGAFRPQYVNYKPKKEIILKSIDDIYTANNKRLYYGLSERERKIDKFVVLDISKNDKFDSKEIKNLFGRNGIHMFGEQTFLSYIENGKRGKFVFNIRKDLKDKDYNNKINKIQNYLKKKQGIELNIDNRKAIHHKKKGNDIQPIFTFLRNEKTNKRKESNQEQNIVKTTKIITTTTTTAHNN